MNDKKEAEKTYNVIASKYHNLRMKEKDFNNLVEQPAIFSLLGGIKNKKILDAGCGSGIYSKILAKKGAKVFGLEISGKMLEIAKQYCKGLGINFVKGSIDKIPCPDNSFDIVVASLVVHYLKNPEKAFKEFKRVLKKNGLLVFSTNHPLFWSYKNSQIKNGKTEFVIQDYFKKGRFYWGRHGIDTKIPSYVISLERLFDILAKNKFFVEKFEEPFLSFKKNKEIKRTRIKYLDFPIFIVLKCRSLA